MKRTIFTIDGVAQAYIGYTDGDDWNGFETPYFEVAEALDIMAKYNQLGIDEQMQYDEDRDEFFVYEEALEEFTIWKGKNLVTEDGIKHLYGIGAYYWMWDSMGATKHREVAQQVEEFIYYHDTYNYWDEYDTRREDVVTKITEQFQDLNTFHKAICIMRREDLKAEEIVEALGKILTL